MGTRGRIEVEIPFNAPADRPDPDPRRRRSRPLGGGRQRSSCRRCDQYTPQGDAFSRAVLGERPLEWGIDDAILNMRVIDALFRSARSERWEHP